MCCGERQAADGGRRPCSEAQVHANQVFGRRKRGDLACLVGADVADRTVTERVTKAVRGLAVVSPSQALVRCVLYDNPGRTAPGRLRPRHRAAPQPAESNSSSETERGPPPRDQIVGPESSRPAMAAESACLPGSAAVCGSLCGGARGVSAG